MHAHLENVVQKWLAYPNKLVGPTLFYRMFAETSGIKNLVWHLKPYAFKLQTLTIMSLQCEYIVTIPRILWLMRYMIIYHRGNFLTGCLEGSVLGNLRYFCAQMTQIFVGIIVNTALGRFTIKSVVWEALIRATLIVLVAYFLSDFLSALLNTAWTIDPDLLDEDSEMKGNTDTVRAFWDSEHKLVPFDVLLISATRLDSQILNASFGFQTWFSLLLCYGALLNMLCFLPDDIQFHVNMIGYAIGAMAGYVRTALRADQVDQLFPNMPKTLTVTTIDAQISVALGMVANNKLNNINLGRHFHLSEMSGIAGLGTFVTLCQRMMNDVIWNVCHQANVFVGSYHTNQDWTMQDNVTSILLHSQVIILLTRVLAFSVVCHYIPRIVFNQDINEQVSLETWFLVTISLLMVTAVCCIECLAVIRGRYKSSLVFNCATIGLTVIFHKDFKTAWLSYLKELQPYEDLHMNLKLITLYCILKILVLSWNLPRAERIFYLCKDHRLGIEN